MTEETRHPGGRPTDYNEEIAQAICVRLVEGDSLRQICFDDDMPDKSTVYRWMAAHQQFCDNYALARLLQGDTDADDVGHIAREVMAGRMDPQAARAAMDGLKWTAARRQPKKYGDKVALEHTGKDGGPIETRDLSKLSDEEIAQLETILTRAADPQA